MKIKTFVHYNQYIANPPEEEAVDEAINEFLSGVIVKNISVSTNYVNDRGIILTHTICYEDLAPAPKN